MLLGPVSRKGRAAHFFYHQRKCSGLLRLRSEASLGERAVRQAFSAKGVLTVVLTSGLKKIIGTKAFYKAALAFALPLILQDTVSSFVNLLDNMMIGSLGTEQMSGVAIVN